MRAVETIGALQAQHWPAPPVALASRVHGFALADLFAALQRGDLVAGTLLRATLHLVSAREHPAYAAVVVAAGSDDWRRTDAQPGAQVEQLQAQLRAYAQSATRTNTEIAAFIEDWVQHHPEVLDRRELEQQRALGWRTFLRSSALVRAPLDGRWSAKTPAAYRAAPSPADAGSPRAPVSTESALDTIVRRHLRAFGPAGAEDIASWIGTRLPPVRAALQRLAPELVALRDEEGRPLHDLPDSPRPHPEVAAPPRLLAAFDSVLLAYASKRRARILPDAHRDAIYERANLRIRPSFLIDGLVAGTWSLQSARREATLTLRPLVRLDRTTRGALAQEAERVLEVVQPAASAHKVLFERG